VRKKLSAEYKDRVDVLAATAAEAVHNKTSDRRIIALYPRHRQHTALIALLHKHYADRMYYYALNEEDVNLKSFIRNLSHDAMFPIEFGRNSRAALQTSEEPADWGKALAEDLSTLHRDESFMVLLDSFDTLPRDDAAMYEFFAALASSLPTNVQIIVNGKELRKQPWGELSSEGLGIMLGDDEALGDGIFHEPALRGQLEVYALAGGSRVLIDGRPITAWEGSLPRNLFYFFVDKARVTRAEVFEAFWPTLGVKEATNVFHVTKRKISEKLGYDLTSYENGFYVPNNRLNRLYDVGLFEEYVDTALKAADEAEAEENWFKAVQIYRGQFLKEVTMDWAQQRRAELRDVYAQALISLARIYRSQGKADHALGYFIRATGEKPDREDVHREIMEIYADQGHFDDVTAQYQMLESTLQEKLGIEPSQETRELYRNLRRS
jgi:DNA-binding SARP family transcriptional activator